MSRRGKRSVAAVALSLVLLPFAIEGIYRAYLFVAHRARGSAGPVFQLIGVGESTMNGFPFEPQISIPKVVAKMLDGKVGERRIVVENLAGDGHPIFAQYPIFAEAVAYRDRSIPGAVIIYVGHNESDLRETRAAAWQPGLFENLAEHSFVLRAVRLKLVEWRVIRRARSIQVYEYYLRRTIETALAADLLPILSTVAGNISEVEPNLETSDAAAVRAAMAVVQEQQQRGDCDAIETSCVADAKAVNALAPLLCYSAGKCRQAAGEIAKADELYQRALDLDPRTVFGRATRAQNDVVRKLGAELKIPVVDAVAILSQASASGLLGNEMFGDGQHPNLNGILLISRAYADAIAQAFSAAPPRRFTPEELTKEFGVTAEIRARAEILSGSWLIASAANHPWPNDRLKLAESHLAAALEIAPKDFTAWLDMAIAHAARRGFLQQPDALDKLGKWSVFYRPAACVPEEEITPMIDQFRSLGVDERILAAIDANRAGACAGNQQLSGRD